MIARVPRPVRSALSALTLAGVLATTAVGCTSSDAPQGADGSAPSSQAPSGKVVPPEPHVGFDYQIGGPYTPPSGVGAVSRDRTVKPAAGLYNICYVNAFQAQPDATAWWQTNHPDLLLRNTTGDLVMDEDWGEALLDISTPAKRERLAAIVGEWIDGCATDGYQAVEADNLDSYERSDGRLTPEHDLAFARLLVDRAHAAGLAIGQKNAPDLAKRGEASASTSRSPRSAASTRSAARTRPPSTTACSSSSTRRRASTRPAGPGATRSRSSCGTRTYGRPGSGDTCAARAESSVAGGRACRAGMPGPCRGVEDGRRWRDRTWDGARDRAREIGRARSGAGWGRDTC